MKPIDVGVEFNRRLANRNKLQGDGTFTAVEFRDKYLKALDSADAWENDSCMVELDFHAVKRIGPSFANEAFAYFCQYAKPDRIRKKIRLINIDEVDETVVRKELSTGYKKN